MQTVIITLKECKENVETKHPDPSDHPTNPTIRCRLEERNIVKRGHDGIKQVSDEKGALQTEKGFLKNRAR
jgi:hypothetical protein